jgi:hypothetical protein
MELGEIVWFSTTGWAFRFRDYVMICTEMEQKSSVTGKIYAVR